MPKLVRKAIDTFINEGSMELAKRTRQYILHKIVKDHEKSIETKHYKDFLYINGCALPHPARYRVHHQVEQLHFQGYSCDIRYYNDINPELVKYYRAFVFFRCPHTAEIEELISRSKRLNKRVFFDIDDLVISEEYVRDIKYLTTMVPAELGLYMDGVQRMQRTLRLCDAAITTTDRLAAELRDYVSEVFINRNVASERMVELSRRVLDEAKSGSRDRVVLGYFSGSITHNEDFRLILPTIQRILEEFPHVTLTVVGLLDLPSELQPFGHRVIRRDFVDWQRLPSLIADIDINLVPLEKTIFNEAKSENKWVEAALVKVPTIASRVGAFEAMIRHEETGLLCDSAEDWYEGLIRLIENEDERERLAKNAYEQVSQHCVSAYTGHRLASFMESKLSRAVAFVLPSTRVSGGVNVAIRHASILQKHGADVTLLSMDDNSNNIVNSVMELPVISLRDVAIHASFECGIATLWSTLEFINQYPKIRHKYYLVQNFETDFYQFGHPFRIMANLTYNSFYNLHYVTISKWCQNWLANHHGKCARYARNGIDLEHFFYIQRNFSNNKICILIEGGSDDYYKNVDESFQIVDRLDPRHFEIWYLSYAGKPKSSYRVDRFFHRVPYSQVAEIYQSCHVLLKSSLLESFSYPPLEMMATGGVAVVARNHGNAEYLQHRENCILYDAGQIEEAVAAIHEICDNEELRNHLIENGIKTARSRDWNKIEAEVLALYTS